MDVTLISNLLGAIGLGAASGLNAWIPLLGLGIAERLGAVTLTAPFDRLGSTQVLVVLGILFALDLIGDKIAVIDHVLHAVGTVVAPLSGAVVFAAQENLVSQSNPWLAALAGMALGETVHLARSAARPAVTAGTGGAGNPVVSVLEDVLAVLLTVFAVVIPILAIGLLVVVSVVVGRRVRRWRRRRAARRAGPPEGNQAPPPGWPRAVP